jgi:F420-non-reducing hydrogenase iron-sulfur subunit
LYKVIHHKTKTSLSGITRFRRFFLDHYTTEPLRMLTPAMDKKFIPKITVFHCINAFTENTQSIFVGRDDFEVKFIKLPCSSMVKDVFLLRAFEAGADGVVVLVCPQGQCRYVEGNIRAKKRVAWVKNLLDEIGIDGGRLSLSNIAAGDTAAATQIIDKALKNLAELGRNPAA